MERMPLGDYEPFRRWSGHARAWGAEEARWRAWMGGGVIDGLCELLDDHLDHRRSSRNAPAALGCVPWLTSRRVAERLERLTACCVVTNKGGTREGLLDAANPFPNVLPSLRMTMPADNGEVPLLGPASPEPVHDLGPVRVVGWQEDRKRTRPILHAKVLVLGDLLFTDEGPNGEVVDHVEFAPRSVWWGSANWTDGALEHLELATWADDRTLADTAAEFLADVIRFSEPADSTHLGPEPDLVEVEFDDEAMREAAYEQWLAHTAEEPEDDR